MSFGDTCRHLAQKSVSETQRLQKAPGSQDGLDAETEDGQDILKLNPKDRPVSNQPRLLPAGDRCQVVVRLVVSVRDDWKHLQLLYLRLLQGRELTGPQMTGEGREHFLNTGRGMARADEFGLLDNVVDAGVRDEQVVPEQDLIIGVVPFEGHRLREPWLTRPDAVTERSPRRLPIFAP